MRNIGRPPWSVLLYMGYLVLFLYRLNFGTCKFGVVQLLLISWTVLVAVVDVDYELSDVTESWHKDQTRNPASIPNKDIIQRLNFLYQASVYLSNLSRDVLPTDVPHPGSSALSAREEDQRIAKLQISNRDTQSNPDAD